MLNGPGHTGLFPTSTIESDENILNLCSFLVVASQIGILRTALFDSNGNAVTIGTSAISTATLSSVGDSASSVTVLAANSSRLGAVIFNDSGAILYLKFGATASTSSFTYRLTPYSTLEIKSDMLYKGIIDGIWASDAGGNARVTEFT